MIIIIIFQPPPPLMIGIIIEVNDNNSGRPLKKAYLLIFSTICFDFLIFSFPIWSSPLSPTTSGPSAVKLNSPILSLKPTPFPSLLYGICHFESESVFFGQNPIHLSCWWKGQTRSMFSFWFLHVPAVDLTAGGFRPLSYQSSRGSLKSCPDYASSLKQTSKLLDGLINCLAKVLWTDQTKNCLLSVSL